MAVGVGHSQFSRDLAVQGCSASSSSVRFPGVLGRGRNFSKYAWVKFLSGQEKAWFQMADRLSQAVFAGAGPALVSCGANMVGSLPFPQLRQGRVSQSPELNHQRGHAYSSGPGLWLTPAWLPTPRNSILEARGEKLRSCRPAPAWSQHTDPQEELIPLGRDRLGDEDIESSPEGKDWWVLVGKRWTWPIHMWWHPEPPLCVGLIPLHGQQGGGEFCPSAPLR